MTDKQAPKQAEHSNAEKDPADWVTGDEPMTGAQRSYLKTLSAEAKQLFDASLTKADASRRIDALQARTGRGTPADDQDGRGAPADDHDGRAASAGGHAGRGTSADDGHPPANEPPDESALESLGKAVSEPMLGDKAATPASGNAKPAS